MNIDIEKMAEDLDLNGSVLHEALGMRDDDISDLIKRLESANTLGDTLDVFNDTPSGSEIELLALNKALRLASNFKEVSELLGYTARYAALKNIVEKALTLATSSEEVSSLIDDVEEDDPDYALRSIISEMHNVWLRVELEEKQSFIDVMEFADALCDGDNIKAIALEKAMTLAQNVDQFNELCLSATPQTKVWKEAVKKLATFYPSKEVVS